ncbi:MAG: pyruvate kinase [Cyclobacteriaceae bacterium]
MKTAVLSLEKITREKALQQLADLALEMEEAEKSFTPELSHLHHNFKLSGANLIHYLVLRSNEIREMQEYLHAMGLSSLANSESHILAHIYKVLGWLSGVTNHTEGLSCNFEVASKLRRIHAEQLLGVAPLRERPHIMVTFSTELASDRMLIEEMLMEGMSVARINCAHDNPETWLTMIHVLKSAIAKTGKNCKVYMDLAGPKIRIKKMADVDGKAIKEIEVQEGQTLRLTANQRNQEHAKSEFATLRIEPANVLGMIRQGEHIYFDDGKFEAKVQSANESDVFAQITRISTKNPWIKVEKGINLPDSELTISALTEEDKSNIGFICKHADMVGFSFVNSPEGIEQLRAEIAKQQTRHAPAIVLKIERLSAVQNLPSLLMAGMKDESFGVMIARGDLAVEIGFERLSEIQEEILWICEAAHVPVIWATQVLENLNKTGYATRSEITDAAMGVRSECVMLNKGKYIVKTIRTLEDILTRQLGHINKKRYIMRPLGIAKEFIQSHLEC